MRIVIDAFQVSPVMSGTDRLAQNVIREMASADRRNDYVIVTNGAVPSILAENLPSNFSIEPVYTRSRFVWFLLRLPGLLRRTKADVFFSFHNFAGPWRSKARTVCTTLDTIPFRRPDLYFGGSHPLKRLVVTTAMRRAGHRADVIIAISEFTKRDVAEVLGINRDRITVIPLQADPRFFLDRTETELDKVRQRYALPLSFVFALGGSDPRKNIERLVAAHRRLPHSLRAASPLVLGGAEWHGRALASGEADPYVRCVGYIDDADLPSVFRLALLFAFPSLFEGFGLTVIEAMASGTPVIASNTTSIPEVAGDAALLFDPTDVESIRLALHEVMSDGELRDRLVAAGRERCAQFSWKRAAAILLPVLSESPR